MKKTLLITSLFFFLLTLTVTAFAKPRESLYGQRTFLTLSVNEKIDTPTEKEDSPKITETFEVESNTVRLYFPDSGEIKVIDIEEYLVGVLMGEMSPTAPYEALKAMAVAARTYTLYFKERSKNKDYDITADSRVSQAYVETSADDDIYNNIKTAISDTTGEILMYDGDIACALYHASSYMYTENCEDVFVESLDYLKSVSSFETAESAYVSEKKYKISEINYILRSNGYPMLSELSFDFRVEKDEKERCRSILLFDDHSSVYINSSDFRNMFSLRSTSFDMLLYNGELKIVTYGYGHGVGLSQNGAKLLAEKGCSYEYILKHYYSGTEIFKTVYKK